jgi:hypothetical protein
MAFMLAEEKTEAFIGVHNAILDLLKARAFPSSASCTGNWPPASMLCFRFDFAAPMRGSQCDFMLIAQSERLDVLPNGSHLAFGNYGEASRPLKRVLKQARARCMRMPGNITSDELHAACVSLAMSHVSPLHCRRVQAAHLCMCSKWLWVSYRCWLPD